MPASRRSFSRVFNRAFTLIELLVTIGIIATLLAVLSVGIARAGESARQTQYLSNLKQVGTAWTLYANQNEDRCLPGYMDDGVQDAFRVRIKTEAGTTMRPEYCRTYGYRLLPYLEHDRTLMYEYIADYEDVSNIPPQVIANNPAYGYNAYYVGGWWTMENGAPKMKFSGTGYYKNPSTLIPRLEVVARSIGQIRATSNLVIFTASTAAAIGFIKEPLESSYGSAWVVPHILAETNIWAASDGMAFDNISANASDDSAPIVAGAFASIARFHASLLGGHRDASAQAQVMRVQGGGAGMQVFVKQSVPLRRIKNVVQTITADLATTTQGLRDLMDQRKWIDVAGNCDDPYNFKHPAQ